MKVSVVQQTKAEIARLSAAIQRLENMQGTGDETGDRYYVISPDTASVRRASMDLTRMLAVLRRGY